MADVKLGISGSEVTLATCISISVPTALNKTMETATVSDGNVRYAMYAGHRAWALSWTQLTAAELTTLKTLRGYNQTLRFQDNYESATWYTVVITSFSYDTINAGGTGTVYYTAEMTIEQTV